MGKGRAPCCDKGRVNKGPWSQEEDLKLITFIQRYGHNNWRSLPKLAGLARCGKSCRLRWVNYLRPDLKRGSFTSDEEETIIRLQSLIGNKWSKIASHLPGRTDNEIKNVWNTHLKKRLRNSSLDSKSAPLIQMSTDNGTVELSSSDCSADDCSNHDVTNVTQTASSPTVDDGKNTNELLEIPYDEANTVDVWDSLLMLDVGTGYTRSNSSIDIISEMEVENSFGWQLGLLDSHEGQGMINMDSDSRTNAINGDKEKSKCEQVEGLAASHSNEGLLKVDNMESYFEVMAWPTSPTYDSYLGL